MTSSYIESVLLKRLCECSLIEESIGWVRESSLEEIFVDENVELVCFNYDGHIKKILILIRRCLLSTHLLYGGFRTNCFDLFTYKLNLQLGFWSACPESFSEILRAIICCLNLKYFKMWQHKISIKQVEIGLALKINEKTKISNRLPNCAEDIYAWR